MRATRYQGEPCIYGHEGERYASSRGCVKCSYIRGKAGAADRQEHRVRIYNKSATYVPAEPCLHGHTLRFTASNNCVECDRIGRKKHKRVKQFARLQKEYGLTPEQHAALADSQGGVCAICSGTAKDLLNFHVDHCHTTKRVRGLLCNKCNQGIGLLQDSTVLLEKAAEYLRK